MDWNGKKYNTLNYDLKSRFGEKIIKLAINGGMTCPNRDGTLGTSGCLFCGEAGAGEYAGDVTKSVSEQMDDQVQQLKEKWPNAKYIAYFQSYTNTYETVDRLRELFTEAISYKNVVGLAIATRPDCLSEEILDLLSEFNKKTFLWLEIGLQTKHEFTANLIRRGYNLSLYEKVHEELKKRNIREVLHLIVGLPHEKYNMLMETAKYLAKLNVYGVKIHLLHILKNTDLEEYYKENEFDLLDQETYINYVIDILEKLPPTTTIHRLTGDGKKDLLVGPLWSLNKRSTLNGIDKEIAKRGTWQGKLFIGE